MIDVPWMVLPPTSVLRLAGEVPSDLPVLSLGHGSCYPGP